LAFLAINIAVIKTQAVNPVHEVSIILTLLLTRKFLH